MDMNIAKMIACGIGGALVGAAVTYVYMVKHGKIEYEIVADPNKDSKEPKRDAEPTREEIHDDKNEPVVTVERVDPDDVLREDTLLKQSATASADYIDYSNIGSEEVERVANEALSQHEEDLNTEPYVMTENEFDALRSDFEAVVCNVYTDGVIVDEASLTYPGETLSTLSGDLNIIDESCVGEDILNEFLVSDDQVRFVCNPSIGMKYELRKMDCESDEYAASDV